MTLQVETEKNLAQIDALLADKRLPYVADSYAYARRKTRVVMVGDVGVGGDNPIRVQSMTTADTMNTEETVAEAIRMVDVGCEIVRITTPQVKDAENLRNIREEMKKRGYRVPLVADVHFNPSAAMEAAKWADKVRINPGNFADAKKFAVLEYTNAEYERELARIETRFKPLVLLCKQRGVSMRIGTNHGSLSDRIMNRFGDTPEGMVESALEFALIAGRYDYHELIFSMKASNPKVMVQAYRLLAARLDALGLNYPFHLGVTEAGNAEDGRIKSAIGIGSLLEDGIGDTIRVSLTEDPEREIPVALRIARRYTQIEQHLLDLSSITDTLPLLPMSENPNLAHLEDFAPNLPDTRDPYHYTRLATRSIELNGAALGGENVPQVIATLPQAKKDEFLHKAHGAGRTLILAAQPKRKPEGEPDIYLYPLNDAGAAHTLKEVRQGAGVPLPVLVTVSNTAQALTALENQADALAFTLDVTAWDDQTESELQAIAQLSAQHHRPLWLKTVSQDATQEFEAMQNHAYDIVKTLLQMAEVSLAQGQQQLVLALGAATTPFLLRAYRLLAARLQERGWDYPIHLTAPTAFATAHPDDVTIDASITMGGLLIDGIGSSVEINYPVGQLTELEQSWLAFNILQAAGTRSSKAEFIACPSCGRTLFDLQSTTDRIKARTKHLVGVKIAIMGCIVNGLGELADADFGYMGGAVGKVNLFVGKECVEKGVPTATADERLIELIKQHGRWIDPE